MAKIRSGILGNIRGKVAGVVGGQFKDVNYLREYVKPANPNTAAQQTQRTKMADCVEFAKPLVGPIFNEYTDKFQKSMSGFNFFIKRNIAEFDGSPDYSVLKITEGKLSAISTLASTYTPGTGLLSLTWAKNLGNNGADDDSVCWLCYDTSTGIFYFQDAVVDRSTEADTQTIETGLNYNNLRVWAFCAQYVGTILDIISDAVYDAVDVA